MKSISKEIVELENGVYDAIWSGYNLDILSNNDNEPGIVLTIKTNIGVKGVNIFKYIKVKNGKIKFIENTIKNKLLKFISDLAIDEDFKNLNYTLTINYKKIVEGWFDDNKNYKYEKFDSNKIIDLITPINVKSFNLTLIDEFNNNIEYDYNQYYYRLNYIFYGQKNIKNNLYFSSTRISLNQLSEKESKLNIKVIKKIANIYKRTSKKLYNSFKKLEISK